ncbi:esterase/lipase family protein [Aquabacterium sp.]|uniref:esterase/lipase family protein n=1 Tax=Aquabacterium sp. TaxID=1872578 RepID=UPI002BD60222|nr:alpha/beta hydrolase [Aquabacterium sp.]HSW04917.1 alpha/beta hydrolase [Aquabacterium sp.]
MSKKQTAAGPLVDLRGGLRLAADATQGVTGIVEALHATIARVALPLGRAPQRKAKGIAGLVYRTVDGTAGLIGKGLDALLTPFEHLLPSQASPRRDALVAALNGVCGDHLERSGNPLAITLQLRWRGQRLDMAGLAAQIPQASSHIVVLVHGLCMSDHGWLRDGHDHGAALAKDLGVTPVYALYNSGRHVSANGAALAEQLQALVQHWPVPVQQLTIVCHSMGGLIARSACHQAAQSAAGQDWLKPLRRLIFIGTPHHGAPLERGGNWLHRVMDVSPYVAPFTRLSGLRSEGITDLRHGNLLEADWAEHARDEPGDRRAIVPLPAGVASYAMASTVGGHRLAGSLVGDGLVTVDSALGHHADPARALGLAKTHQSTVRDVHHMGLLGSPAVYRKLKRWVASD